MALVEEDSLLPDILAGGWTRTSLEQLARDLGVIKRARKKGTSHQRGHSRTLPLLSLPGGVG